MTDPLAEAKKVAEAASGGGKPDRWHRFHQNGECYVGTATPEGELEALAAEYMEVEVADFIATFDPETVTALLDAVQAASELMEVGAFDSPELEEKVDRVEALLSSKGGRG